MQRICRLTGQFQSRLPALTIAAQLRRPIGVRSLCLQSTLQQHQQHPQPNTGLTTASERSDVSTDVRPLGERIKENTKTASYAGVIVVGAIVTAGLFVAVFRELWSRNSPNNVYSAALERCANDPRIQDTLGAPIKGFGEETSRRRRTHVAHQVYERNGVRFMRMQFYIQGVRNKATVHLEMRENSSGNFDYRYLFAQVEHYPRSTIVLEDNRALESTGAEDAGPIASLPSGLSLSS